MKFGVFLPQFGGWLIGAPVEEPEISYRHVARVAMEAEDRGFHSVWLADHMLNPRKGEQVPALESWTTLTALATCTSRVKLGQAVICQSFRYPAVLAKMASTLDEISKGRFILGIGAGWWKREFDAYGIPWTEHDNRILQAEEQIKLIKALWTQDRVDFNGEFYHISQGILEPKPVQKPSPPIWYGGDSENSVQLVIRNHEVDCWIMTGASPEKVRAKIADIKGRLTGGRRIEFAMSAFCLNARTEAEGGETVTKIAAGKSGAINWAMKSGLVGPYEKIAEQIRAFSEAGIDYLLLFFNRPLDNLKAFSENIIKKM